MIECEDDESSTGRRTEVVSPDLDLVRRSMPLQDGFPGVPQNGRFPFIEHGTAGICPLWWRTDRNSQAGRMPRSQGKCYFASTTALIATASSILPPP